jgi:hypothetical protein
LLFASYWRFLCCLVFLLCHPLACLCLPPTSVHRSIWSVGFLWCSVNSSVTMLVLHLAICLVCQLLSAGVFLRLFTPPSLLCPPGHIGQAFLLSFWPLFYVWGVTSTVVLELHFVTTSLFLMLGFQHFRDGSSSAMIHRLSSIYYFCVCFALSLRSVSSSLSSSCLSLSVAYFCLSFHLFRRFPLL